MGLRTHERIADAMDAHTTDSPTGRTPRARLAAVCGGGSKKGMLIFGAALGAVLGIAMGIGSGLAVGLGSFCCVVGYTVLVVALGGRFEPMAVLSATNSDERRRQIDLKATAAVGRLLVVVLIAGAAWEVAHGSNGPMVWLCAIGGAGYIAAVAYYSRRG